MLRLRGVKRHDIGDRIALLLYFEVCVALAAFEIVMPSPQSLFTAAVLSIQLF